MTRTTARSGLTLLELLLVMAIIVMLAAFAAPSYDSVMAYTKTVSASDSIKAAWAQARSRAIEDSIQYRFAIIPDSNYFRVAPDRPDYWTGSVPTPDDPENPPLVLEDRLPKGVLFRIKGDNSPIPNVKEADEDDGPGDPSRYQTIGIFLEDGTSRDDIDVPISVPGAAPITLRFRAMSGTVKTITGNEER